MGWMMIARIAAPMVSRVVDRAQTGSSPRTAVNTSRNEMNRPTAASIAVRPSQYSEIRTSCAIGSRAVGRAPASGASVRDGCGVACPGITPAAVSSTVALPSGLGPAGLVMGR